MVTTSEDGLTWTSDSPVLVVFLQGDVANDAAKLPGVLMATFDPVTGSTMAFINTVKLEPENQQWACHNAQQFFQFHHYQVNRVHYSPFMRVVRNPHAEN